MEAKQRELEARIVAIEYTLQVIINCLSDRQSLDREKVLRLLRTAAAEPGASASPCGSSRTERIGGTALSSRAVVTSQEAYHSATVAAGLAISP